MNGNDNILKAVRDLVKNFLLKSYVCYLFLNLNNICIYCKVLKSVTVNCWKKSNHLCAQLLEHWEAKDKVYVQTMTDELPVPVKPAVTL